MNSKILIIDDEKDICFLISEILKDEKFITESTLNSTEAIKIFETFKGMVSTINRVLYKPDRSFEFLFYKIWTPSIIITKKSYKISTTDCCIQNILHVRKAQAFDKPLHIRTRIFERGGAPVARM